MKRLEDYPLNLKQTAHKLGCTANAARRLVAAGKLKAEKFGPLRELRFKEEDVDQFLANCDAGKLHRQLVARIRATEPHYQGLLNLPNR